MLVLDEALLEQLGWEADMGVELVVRDGALVVTRDPEGERKFREAMEKIDEQYGNVFRRLADS